jgi:hypothetical protein
MAVAVRAVASNRDDGVPASPNTVAHVLRPTGVVAGDLLVMVLSTGRDNASGAHPTPAGWTKIGSTIDRNYGAFGGFGVMHGRHSAYWKIADAGDTSAGNVTVGAVTAVYVAGSMIAYYGNAGESLIIDSAHGTSQNDNAVGDSDIDWSADSWATDIKSSVPTPWEVLAVGFDYTMNQGAFVAPTAPAGFTRETSSHSGSVETMTAIFDKSGPASPAPAGSGGSHGTGDTLVRPAAFHLVVGQAIPPNTPPVATGQAVTVNQDSTANTITVSATDADGDPLTYSVVSGPTHGAVGAFAGNVIHYTPTPGYHGADSFTFKANDSIDDSNTATVTITVTQRFGPSLSTFSVDAQTDARADIHFRIVSEVDDDSDYYVEFGPTTGYGRTLVTATVAAGATLNATIRVKGLIPNTTYHWRVVASNVHATTTGADQSFTTDTAPTTRFGRLGSGVIL